MSNILAIDEEGSGIGRLVQAVLEKECQDVVTIVTNAWEAFEQI